MSLLEPMWLLLIIPAALAVAAWPPPRRSWRFWRVLSWILLIAALTAPLARLPGRGGTLVVVADRSESMPAEGLAAQPHQIGALLRRRQPGQSMGVVSFRQEAALEMAPGETAFQGFRSDVPGGQSNLHDALVRALDLTPSGGRGRVVVLSDGQWSGADPAPAAAQAASRGIAIDVHLQQRPTGGDLAIVDLQGPETVGCNEGFLITAWYQNDLPGPVRYELRRGDLVIARGTHDGGTGRQRLLFRDLCGAPGTADYTLRLESDQPDAVPENNTARLLVGVRGPRAVLLVRPTAQASGLAAALRASGMAVEEQRPGDALDLARLSGCSAVVLENVPARAVGTASLHDLAAWVQTAGGGLMLTGGEQSYGQGGYLKSPLEPLLPVSLELRREHRTLSQAIVIALDRSGSMAAPAGPGRTKMDLANLGTAEVIRLLTAGDHVGVIAVDSAPHEVLPLSPAETAQARLGKVLGITSAGGGIFVYEALSRAAAMLARAPQKNRHIILFADAADAEEPGEYQALLATCRQAGIAVSVVGLGHETDTDAALLRDVAERGGGRCIFSANPEELPAIFAEETFAILGSAFSDEPAGLRFATPWLTLGGLPVTAAPSLEGHNRCFLRPEALQAVATDAAEPDPVVAFWQAGAGRVLCYTGEADGPYGRSLAAWDRAGEFFATLGRWTAGATPALPEGMVALRECRDGLCRVALHLDPDRPVSWPALPRVHWLRRRPGASPTTVTQGLSWAGPDELAAGLALQANETVLPVLEFADGSRAALPPACLPCPPEFAPPPPGRGAAALRRLADLTGGREVPEVSGLWSALPRVSRPWPLRPWLFLGALLAVFLEVVQRRSGWPRWRGPAGALAGLRGRLGRRQPSPSAVPAGAPAATPGRPAAAPSPTAQPAPAMAPEPPPGPPPSGASQSEALRQARERARQRLKR